MKKYCHILYIAVMMLLPALNLNAQSNEKPVWVIAHGANWKYSTDRALELGANGVEVDIRTKNTFWNLFYDNTEGKHWSLGHDTYHEYAECDKDNPRAVSLEWMLTGKVTRNYTTTLNDDERFCVLWLDVKNEKYIKELVKYVHDRTPNGTRYSIIYNVYDRNFKSDVLVWLGQNLRSNEYINWGDQLIKKLRPYIDGKIQPKNHFYSRGIFNVNQPQNSKRKRNHLREAASLAKEGKFCKRVGVWSSITAANAISWINEGREIVLVYYDKGYRPTVQCRPSALPELVKYYKSGAQKGKTHIATRNDEAF